MGAPRHGFSEIEVEFIFHCILLMIVSIPLSDFVECHGSLGLTYGESLPFKKKTGRIAKYSVDTALQMWLTQTKYITMLIFEMKKSIIKSKDVQDGEKEIFKYTKIITNSCKLDVFYAFLIGIDSYYITSMRTDASTKVKEEKWAFRSL